MLHADLHGLHVDLHVARDGCDQIILKGIKLGRRQIRAVVDKDELQALLGVISAVFSAKETIERLISLPPRQALKLLPQSPRVIQIEEWYFLST